MIIGVPIFAVIYAAIRSAINTLLKKKKLPTDGKQYEEVDYVDEEGNFHKKEISENIKNSSNKKRETVKTSVTSEETETVSELGKEKADEISGSESK